MPARFEPRNFGSGIYPQQISSKTQLITQNYGLQALSSKKSAKNQCVINSVQLLTDIVSGCIGIIKSSQQLTL
ncbi:hypothetical protein, partial [Microcoleus sp. herbarium8]|uniref:hypothetical protein n=1 Tax=Microcoleus sp. herbarium8 TaxID=3055436 RepID=UPI002FD3E37A